MARIAGFLLLGIAVGAGFAYWSTADRGALIAADGPAGAAEAALERRLSELETALALERFERQALADELTRLRAAVTGDPGPGGDALAAAREPSATAGSADERASRTVGDERARQRAADQVPQTAEERAQLLRQRRFENFVAAGLAPDRAQYILERQDALEWEALEARYEATQSGATPAEVAALNPDALLRAELGEADYEKYLAGSGRPTTIRVNEVLQNSPAAAAGLQSGDEIVSYNGRRVFDIGELNALTNELKPGQSVTLAIERDGQPLQFIVESGPIGISGGGRSTRRGR